MKLHSYTFPVKLENEGYENFEFTAPYTITATLQIENSHYVGYTFTDSNDVAVDVLDILAIKDYIKANPGEFTNALVNEISGQLDIDGFEDLDHLESLEYKLEHEKTGLNDALLKLLEVDDVPLLPRKIYNITKQSKYKAKCKLTKEFKNYIKKVKKHTKKTKTCTKIIIPPPLLQIGEQKVEIFDSTFNKLELLTLDVDFSLIDLRNCTNADFLFQGSTFKELNICTLNLNPITFSQAFSCISCDKLSLKNCDFSNTSSLKYLFGSAVIGLLETTNFNNKCNDISTYSNIFSHTNIGVLDLEIFANIPPEDFAEFTFTDNYYYYTKTFNFFNESSVDKMINIDKLPTQKCKTLPYLFDTLSIKELDIRELRIDSLEDFSNLFSGLIANELIFDPKMFAKAKRAIRLFEYCEIHGDLDLSKADFTNLSDKAFRDEFDEFDEFDDFSLNNSEFYKNPIASMFRFCTVEGEITLPSNFGDMVNFDRLCEKLQAHKMNLEHVDFSKVESMEKFLLEVKVQSPIKFPTSQELLPKNLTNASKFISLLKTTELDLSGWDFDGIDIDEFDFLFIPSSTEEITFDDISSEIVDQDYHLIDEFGEKVLGLNVQTLKLSINSQIHKAISRNEQWNNYYSHKHNETQVIYNLNQNLFE